MNSHGSWDIRVDENVYKALKKTPRRDGERILEVIRLLPFDPYFGDIQKMKGEPDSWRRRIGSYRLFYRIKNEVRVVLVFRLERRTSNTY